MDYEQAFAIVRLGASQGADNEKEPEVFITVKKIVWASEVAEAEAPRRHKLNEKKGAG